MMYTCYVFAHSTIIWLKPKPDSIKVISLQHIDIVIAGVVLKKSLPKL